MKDWRRVFLAVAALLVWGPPLAAQTGRIVGRVVSDDGQVLPGAAVIARSESLQGVRSAKADARGEFIHAFLPPGTYEITVEHPGFGTAVIGGVRVELDHTATVRARLKVAALSTTVEVEARPPEIDVTNSATGLNATEELYTRLPLERSFYAVARVAPGTQEDEAGTAFSGSSGAENQYVIDGLNTTDAYDGGKGKELNLDFVDAVEVKTGGLPAEYGRTTGGILNVLTRSGGNDFHGSAFGFFAGGGLQSDNRTASERPGDTTTVDDTTRRWDYGTSLGGRIVRDRLWFFAAFNRVAEDTASHVIRELQSPGAPGAGSNVTGQSRDNRFSGKLTWRPAVSSTLALSLFGDPRRFEGPVAGINGPASTYEGTIDGGGTDLTLRYEGTFGASSLVRGLCGRHRQSFDKGGIGTEIAQLVDFTVTPPAYSGGIGAYGGGESTRDACRIDVSRFWKRHELKVGGDLESVTGVSRWSTSGGDQVFKVGSGEEVYYVHVFLIDESTPGFDRSDASTWQYVPFASSSRTRNVSAYAQDAWRLGRGVTLNLGLRYERQAVGDRNGNVPLSVDNWAPRVGAAWDVRQDGRSKLYAAFSRYFESIPQYIQFFAFSGFTLGNSFNLDSTPGSFAPDPAAPRAVAFGGTPTVVASGVRGQYVDEWLLGFEREIGGDFMVGFRGTHRGLGRVIEDLNSGTGSYLIGNPGEGDAATLAFFDGSSVPSPKARRGNTSLELTARKRFSRGWQLLASYVWSRLEGNYDGTYQRSTGEWSPNFSSGFDFADTLVNAQGPLTSESVQQIKLDGSYELRGWAAGLNVGLSTHWFSGLPANAYGFSAAAGAPRYYLAPRGSVGRNPSDFETHIHVSYPIRLGQTLRLQLLADLFNLFDRQAIVRYDERYNTAQDGSCAGVPEGLCATDGALRTRPGTLEPLAQLSDPRLTATNPDYLRKGIAFTGQRSLRLGIRLTF